MILDEGGFITRNESLAHILFIVICSSVFGFFPLSENIHSLFIIHMTVMGFIHHLIYNFNIDKLFFIIGIYYENHKNFEDDYSWVSKMYAHQVLNHIMVNEITIVNNQPQPFVLGLTQNQGNTSEDIDFKEDIVANWR